MPLLLTALSLLVALACGVCGDGASAAVPSGQSSLGSFVLSGVKLARLFFVKKHNNQLEVARGGAERGFRLAALRGIRARGGAGTSCLF